MRCLHSQVEPLSEFIPAHYRPTNQHCTTVMHWLYTDTAIIVPPQRFATSDAKLWFELAFLEFHMHFGNVELQEPHGSLLTDMYNYLCTDRTA